MRLLTFLSDFGLASPYPAAMKAVAASICDARIIDISHAVPRHDVRAGAYLLWSVAPSCPAGTVHCAVVDPGVGTARAALAVAAGAQIFVGPDNGLLIPAARRLGSQVTYRLTNAAYWRRTVAPTFHGRDVFAPVAAHLAAGLPVDQVGEPAAARVDLALESASWDGRVLSGTVLWIDPFGNVVTTIPGSMLERLRLEAARPRVRVETGTVSFDAIAGRTFGEVPSGAAVVFEGSDGLVEIAFNRASAAAAAGVRSGDGIRVRKRGYRFMKRYRRARWL